MGFNSGFKVLIRISVVLLYFVKPQRCLIQYTVLYARQYLNLELQKYEAGVLPTLSWGPMRSEMEERRQKYFKDKGE